MVNNIDKVDFSRFPKNPFLTKMENFNKLGTIKMPEWYSHNLGHGSHEEVCQMLKKLYALIEFRKADDIEDDIRVLWYRVSEAILKIDKIRQDYMYIVDITETMRNFTDISLVYMVPEIWELYKQQYQPLIDIWKIGIVPIFHYQWIYFGSPNGDGKASQFVC